MSLKFGFNSCETVFPTNSGWEFQTVGPKTEKDLFPKVSREKRGTVSREASREGSVLGDSMKKVRKIWWYPVLIHMLKTEKAILY